MEIENGGNRASAGLPLSQGPLLAKPWRDASARLARLLLFSRCAMGSRKAALGGRRRIGRLQRPEEFGSGP